MDTCYKQERSGTEWNAISHAQKQPNALAMKLFVFLYQKTPWHSNHVANQFHV